MSPFSPGDLLCTFREQEGVTVIVKSEVAERMKLEYRVTYSWITLSVDSSLEAIGFTATFSSALAAENVSCNVIAAYHHDHIFVPSNQKSKAMDILFRLSKGSGG